jgi:hypothetical protein
MPEIEDDGPPPEWFGGQAPEDDGPPPGYCQEFWDRVCSLVDDPLTSCYGAPVDEIVDGWERSHVRTCSTCRERTELEGMP